MQLGWLLPLLAGGAAIYMLLPQPRLYPMRRRAGLGLLALALAVVPLADNVFPLESILFWSFSALAIVAGVLLVTQHNPARAALAFALVVLSTCGLFLLLAAPFLMAATIIIYAGAIIVTFLFVIMLAQQSGLSDADDRSREPMLATLTGFLLLGTILFVLQGLDGRIHAIDALVQRARDAAKLDTRADMQARIGQSSDPDELFNQFNRFFSTRSDWKELHTKAEQMGFEWSNIKSSDANAVEESKTLLKNLAALGETARHRLVWLPSVADKPLSNLSGPPPTSASEHIRRDESKLPRMPADNAAYLGRSLFSDYLLPVELGGSLLLVATVGALAIALRRS
jgi:NADH-quinone oxidoreductase subunit J